MATSSNSKVSDLEKKIEEKDEKITSLNEEIQKLNNQITELKKNKREHPNVYVFNNAYKKVQIIDRINFEMNWLHTNSFLIVDNCKESIREMNMYSWKEDKDNEPEDRNDHTINARQYAWIPYREVIGKGKDELV